MPEQIPHNKDVPVAPLTSPATCLSAYDFAQLRICISSSNAVQNYTAEQQLQSMALCDITSFLKFVRKGRNRELRNYFLGSGLVALVVLIVAFTVGGPGFISFIGVFPSLVAVPLASSSVALSKVSNTCAKALLRFQDVESVNGLISALEIKDKSIQKVIRPILSNLLPTLRASDAGVLTVESLRTLRRILQHETHLIHEVRYEDYLLRLAILKSLQQVGDSSFIDVVSRLARYRSRWKDDVISAAARECLPYLKEIVRQQAIGAELLRASEAGIFPGADTLVRPVSSAQDLHEAELPRVAGKLDAGN